MTSNTNKIKRLITAFLILSACAPRGSYLYQYHSPEAHRLAHWVVVIDYLNLRDDIGTYWDFDSHQHEITLDHFMAESQAIIQASGWPAADSYVLGSGLLLQHDFPVEHYHRDVFQDELLDPPYLIASQNMSAEHLQQHREVLRLLVRYIANRRHHNDDINNHRGMQMAYHYESLQLPPHTGVLYLHINESATGALKQLGSVLLAGAVASQADHAYVGLDVSNQRHASAFVLAADSGQILWKNHVANWHPGKPLQALMQAFPEAPE